MRVKKLTREGKLVTKCERKSIFFFFFFNFFLFQGFPYQIGFFLKKENLQKNLKKKKK